MNFILFSLTTVITNQAFGWSPTDVYQPECDSLEIISSGIAGKIHSQAFGTYKLIPKVGISTYDVDSPLFKHTYNEFYLVYKAYYSGLKRWEVTSRDQRQSGFEVTPILINSYCDLCKPNHENEKNCPLPTSEHCNISTWSYWNNETQNYEVEADKDEMNRTFRVQCKGCNDAKPPPKCGWLSCSELFKGSCDTTWKSLDKSCNYETKVQDVCMKMCEECKADVTNRARPRTTVSIVVLLTLLEISFVMMKF